MRSGACPAAAVGTTCRAPLACVPASNGFLLVDSWPTAVAHPCRHCPAAGLPMSLAKTKQALLRGYAVASMSSQDRTSGPGARCFAWGDDAPAAARLVRWLPKRLGLPRGAPVYLDGASSGGSLALRLPLEVDVDGVVGGECQRLPGGVEEVRWEAPADARARSGVGVPWSAAVQEALWPGDDGRASWPTSRPSTRGDCPRRLRAHPGRRQGAGAPHAARALHPHAHGRVRRSVCLPSLLLLLSS